jgi:catechol 2,3-dioxygenase-like lactoylglutathione lyase family enzyme
MKFSRVVIKVADYRKSFEFYHDILGFKLSNSWQRKDSWGALFNVGPAIVEIIWFPEGAGLLDCAFQPERDKMDIIFDVSDVDILYQRLQELDINIVKKPYDAPWGYRLFKIKDPDGIPLSFMEPIS